LIFLIKIAILLADGNQIIAVFNNEKRCAFQEETMTRKRLFLTSMVMVLVSILFLGCDSTLMSDPSIVWSDDFGDGDTEGWEEMDLVSGDEFSVNEGILSFGNVGGDIRHPSTITTGTWSMDIYIPEKGGETNEIFFMGAQLDSEGEEWAIMTLSVQNQPYTRLLLYAWPSELDPALDPVTIRAGERLSGWHHIDITRDDSGNVKIYFDGTKYLEQSVDFPYESNFFVYRFCCEGPAIDNVIVKNQVVDIEPTK
jgi:hypothetical protein